MHIADGILSTPVMVGTNIVAAAAVGGSLIKLDYDHIPRVGVMSAVFFMASFISIPVGPASVHLMLTGLMGVLLGWSALPALAVALFLQWVLRGHGGISTLGANTLVMGLPAVIAGIACSCGIRKAGTRRGASAWGAAAGILAVLLTCILFVLLLHISEPRAFGAAIVVLTAGHIPIAILDGIVAATAVGFLCRVRPDMLNRKERTES